MTKEPEHMSLSEFIERLQNPPMGSPYIHHPSCGCHYCKSGITKHADDFSFPPNNETFVQHTTNDVSDIKPWFDSKYRVKRGGYSIDRALKEFKEDE